MDKTHVKAEPKDVFLHLLSIMALYVSAGSFAALVFQYINILIPDPLENYYSLQSALSSVRWNISALVVVFPVYIWSVWFLNKLFKKESARKEVWVRRWLVYFTLFAAAIIIIGDVVALIFNLLGGELTARFLLKVLAVLLVAGSVFLYYFWDLKNALKIGNWELKIGGMKYFVYSIVTVVAISVIAGFFVVGSPQEERLRRFDEQRVSNLQFLQSEIVNFWINKTRLPADLSELRDDIRGISIPADPQIGESYEYSVLDADNLSFELCAVFARSSVDAGGIAPRPLYPEAYLIIGGKLPGTESWEHGEGRTCFERTIDPDLYPPREVR